MIVILGGGLTGLSLAYHLGEAPHVVIESAETPGGIARTREVDGFAFDYTGHLLHLRDDRTRALVDRLLPDAFEVIERNAIIRSHGVSLPFPFQANLHGLPERIVADCIIGFAETLGKELPTAPGTSFRDWSLAVLGKGISEAFMFPYNAKLFCRDPSDMTADWVSWAVPKPNLEEVVRGALGIPNRAMGYNATFRYPKRGGIGILPAAFAGRVSTVRCSTRAVAVDLDERRVTLEGGETLDYSRLVVTIPLPSFLRMAHGGFPGKDTAASRLDWSVVACLNLGVRRPGVGGGAHWIYFPDPDTPFYRVGFPTAFSDHVAPPGCSSMYVEFGLPKDERPDFAALEKRAVDALRMEGILLPTDEIVARDFIVVDPGYVIFDRARQEVMSRIVPELRSLDVSLVGRYGAWTYSYMERSMLDGIEEAERLRRALAAPAARRP